MSVMIAEMVENSKWSKKRIELIKWMDEVSSEDEEFIEMLVESDMRCMPPSSIVLISPTPNSMSVDTSTCVKESFKTQLKKSPLLKKTTNCNQSFRQAGSCIER